MSFDPYNSDDRAKLKSARDNSWRLLQPFRRTRVEMLREYVGSRYSDFGADRMVYVNLLNQTAEAMTISLVAQCPRVLIETDYPEFIGYARKFQVNVNKLIADIHLETTLQRMVLDAFFCIGIVKIGLGNSNWMLGDENEWSDPGSPFAANISLDRWVHDISAMGWEKVRWCGDYYELPKETLVGDDAFDQDEVKKLPVRSMMSGSAGSLRGGEQTAQMITQNRDRPDVDVRPQINLFDVWIAETESLCTFGEDLSNPPLSVRHIPDNPYIVHQVQDVPDNTMPVSPAMNVMSLHESYNSLFRKQMKQAQRQRDIPIFEGDASDDAKRLEKTDDGRWTRVNRRESVDVLKLGGVDQGNHAFSQAVMDIFDRMSGNLRAMAGLGPQADTLGQDEMIHAASGKKEQMMQYKTARSTEAIIAALGKLMWNDPLSVYNAYDTLPNFPHIKIPAEMTPWNKQGDFEDYGLRIEPYSMTYKSPMQRAQTTIQTLMQVYMPLMPVIQQQGGELDVQELNEELSMLLDSPILKRIWKFGGPPIQPQPNQGMQSNPSTTRNYVRQSVSSGDNGQVGRSGQILAMMGADGQQGLNGS